MSEIVQYSADFTERQLAFPGTPTHRVWKRQLRCRRCRREVEKTEQTGLQAGRRIICLRFYCHGEHGDLRICEDQLTLEMIFDVFDGQPELRGPAQTQPPALPDNKPVARAEPKRHRTQEPVTLDVEIEVTPRTSRAIQEKQSAG